jgi:hypothetical protein
MAMAKARIKSLFYQEWAQSVIWKVNGNFVKVIFYIG